MTFLIKDLQRKIEKTYALDTGIANISRFVIGDIGFNMLYGNDEPSNTVNGAYYGARVLLRYIGNDLKALIYFPDRLIKTLEENDPRFGINDDNIDACAGFVEELDHLLFIAQHYKLNRPFSLIELELQANVTKYLTLKYFVALQNRSKRLRSIDKEYIKYHLFYKRVYDISDPSERERYEVAGFLGMLYTEYIDTLSYEDRLRDLRQFCRMTFATKASYIHSKK